MSGQHDLLSLLRGEAIDRLKEGGDDIVHLVIVVVEEDDLIWREDLSAETAQFLWLDLKLR